jgi:hypothetical protein
MPDQPIAPPPRRGPGAPGRPKPACSPAYAPTGIGSSRKATYHSSMPTSPMSPAAATSYLTRTEGRVANDIDGAGPLVVLVPGPGDLRGQVIMVPEAGHYPQSRRPDTAAPAMVRFADTVNNRA